MFDSIAQDSSILSVVNVKYDLAKDNTGDPIQDSESCVLTVRVLNESKWKKLIQEMIMSSAEEDDFGVVVKQEFYLNPEGKPAFVWTVSLWGDLSVAAAYVTPILNKRGAPPPPPASLGISAPVFTKNSPPRVKADGSIVKEIALPHKTGTAKDTSQVINVRDINAPKNRRAFVTGITG